MGQGIEIVIPIIFAFCSQILSVIIMYLTYRKKKFDEYLYLAIGFLLSSSLSAVCLIFLFIEGNKYNQLRSYFGSLGFILTGSGFIVILLYTAKLRGVESKFLDYTVPVFILALGIFSMTIQWEWSNGFWHVYLMPPWGIIPIGLITAILNCKLLYLTYSRLKESKVRQTELGMITLGWALVMFAAIWVIFERLLLSSYTMNYLAIAGLGFLLVATGIYRYPYALFSTSIGLKFFILVDKHTSSPIFSLNFNSEMSHDRLHLFSGAISGIMNLLSDIMETQDNEQITHRFDYNNGIILAKQTDKFVGFLGVEQVIPPLYQIMNSIFEFTNQIKSDPRYLIDSESIKIKQLILNELYFTIAENREITNRTKKVTIKQ